MKKSSCNAAKIPWPGFLINGLLQLFPIISVVFVTGCILGSGGVIARDDDFLLDPLETFSGTTQTDSLSAPFVEKWNSIRNPKIAIVWQFLSGDIPLATTQALGKVSTSSPFDFQGNLFLPPAPSIHSADEVAIAGFWLYADLDRDGRLSLLTHPELRRKYDSAQVLKNDMNAAMGRLLDIADILPVGREEQERYFIDFEGNISLASEGENRLVAAIARNSHDPDYPSDILSAMVETLDSVQ